MARSRKSHRRSSKKRHKRNPSRSRRRVSMRFFGGAKRHKRNPSRSRGRRYKRNPFQLRGIMPSKGNLMNVAGVVLGFVGGIKGGKYLYEKVPATMRRFAGALVVLLGGLITAKSKNQIAKNAGIGLAASGAYDLLTQNVPQIGLMPVSGVDLDYGVEGETISMRRMAGETVDMSGRTDLVGETSLVGGDMTHLVGDDDEQGIAGETGVYAAI